MRIQSGFLSLSIAFVTLFSVASFGQEPQSVHSPRFVVHLLDYLAKDYAGAVAEDGKILSESEYAEQIEFARSATQTGQTLPELKASSELQTKLKELLASIENKAPPSKVAPLARELQRTVIQLTGLEMQPTHWPVMETGRTIYRQSCAVCHGDLGRGDGQGGKGLDPAPANFADFSGMGALSPFAAYNTIRLGVPGTGMPPFPQFSDQEVWALAFYVNAIRFRGANVETLSGAWHPDSKEVLKKTATLNDSALKAQINGDDVFRNRVLAGLRLHSGKEANASYLQLASTKLDDALVHHQAGRTDLARANALQAYLEGVEPVEAKIRATDPEAVVRIEEKMAAVRSALESKASVEDVRTKVDIAKAEIQQIALLTENKEISPWVAFLGAFGIILREGFEAVLIVLALLGVIRATGAARAAHYVHAGWLAAVCLGFVAWFFSGWLMQLSGAGREMLEGISSILAVAVLMYVGFWLHRQTEIGRWKHFLEVQVRGFLDGGKLYGLAAIAFVATFREAIETVLFLRAIWVDSGAVAKNALTIGVGTSLALVIALSWIALRYSRRLPLKKLFTFSSLMMLSLATILAGKGVHALQEAGAISVSTPSFRIRWDLAGVYPTYETLVAQVVTFALILLLWFLGNKPTRPVAMAASSRG